MVRLSRIYTRGGDGGETSLAGGGRVAKHGLRVTAIGDVDEVNATVGLARLHAAGAAPGRDAMLRRIQDDLFDLGADIATPGDDFTGASELRVTPAQVERLESEIDAVNAGLSELSSFVLPAGSPEAAHLHLARTVARRAERALVALAAAESVNPAALRYINRLSDLLFVLSRASNADAGGDVLWRPGANRDR